MGAMLGSPCFGKLPSVDIVPGVGLRSDSGL